MADTSSYVDKTLKCADCKAEFQWTAGEQEWFARQNFTAPRRCKPCRDKRKAEQGNAPAHK
jgi:hypothetical protein